MEIFDTDAAKAERTRKQIHAAGVYGLVSVNRWASGRRLPYAENLVNLVLIEEGGKVPPAEVVRVLRPGGVILAKEERVPDAEFKKAGLEDVQTVRAGGVWTLGRKRWPAEMDEWSHPRHGPGGNAVSADKLFGPTQRVRWLAGPLVHASNIVTAGGRFYYHGVMARNAFNGLLLWNRKLETPPSRIDSSWHGVKGNHGYLTEKRPLAAFRDGAIFTSSDDLRNLCRVDFTPESIAAFGGEWHTHRHKVPRIKESHPKKHGRIDYWLLRAHEDPNNATWTAAEVFGPTDSSESRLKGGGYAWTPDQVHGGGRGLNDPVIVAVVVAGDTVFVAGTHGRLIAYDAADGKKLTERDLPPVVWDGMAAAHGCLYVSTTDGKVLALGRK